MFHTNTNLMSDRKDSPHQKLGTVSSGLVLIHLVGEYSPPLHSPELSCDATKCLSYNIDQHLQRKDYDISKEDK